MFNQKNKNIFLLLFLENKQYLFLVLYKKIWYSQEREKYSFQKHMEILNRFQELLSFAHQKGCPDIHISSSSVFVVRNKNGDLEYIDTNTSPLTSEDVEKIILKILWKENYTKFIENMEFDSSYYHKNTLSRYRVNCYKDIHGFCIALRIIPEEIPSMESLGFGESLRSLAWKTKWLILFTGPTGSGKSTNIASMIEYINTKYKKNIITIEEPIEFVFKNKLSLIHQREVGTHTKSFPSAIKASLREDPDVIVVWEMRDPETIKAVITLAETGHLVLSTLHTNDTVQTIDRIVDIFPSTQQVQIRMQLAMSLVWIIAQRLIPRSDKDERIALREVLMNNDATKNLIISGKTHQLYSVLEVSQKQGMILMDNYLVALYKKGYISQDTVMSFARDTENIRNLLG